MKIKVYLLKETLLITQQLRFQNKLIKIKIYSKIVVFQFPKEYLFYRENIGGNMKHT
jgi:hypothetical protein